MAHRIDLWSATVPPSADQRRAGKLVAGTETARAVASAGGRAAAERRAERRWDDRINELVAQAPELSPRQRDRLAAVFGGRS